MEENKVSIIIPLENNLQKKEDELDNSAINEFNYTTEIDSLITETYNEFGYYKDFDCVIQFALNCYFEKDEISILDQIMFKNKKLSDIIFYRIENATSADLVERVKFEIYQLSKIYEELDTKVYILLFKFRLIHILYSFIKKQKNYYMIIMKKS